MQNQTFTNFDDLMNLNLDQGLINYDLKVYN